MASLCEGGESLDAQNRVARRHPELRHFWLTIGHGLPIPKLAMKRHEGKFPNCRPTSDSKEFTSSK
jgi:hypothetical protein